MYLARMRKVFAFLLLFLALYVGLRPVSAFAGNEHRAQQFTEQHAEISLVTVLTANLRLTLTAGNADAVAQTPDWFSVACEDSYNVSVYSRFLLQFWLLCFSSSISINAP